MVLIKGFVEIVPIASSGHELEVGDTVTITGWGMVNSTTASKFLKTIDMEVVSEQTCSKQWGTANYLRICIVSHNKGWGTCGGDSGGGLLHRGELMGKLRFESVADRNGKIVFRYVVVRNGGLQ